MRLIDANILCVIVCDRFKKKFGPFRLVRNFLWWVLDIIGDAPTVDAEPVRHGRWLPIGPEDDDVYFICSECRTEISTRWDYDADAGWNFCPCCGAKMDGRMEVRQCD